jgi:hypothetical protein
MKKYLFASGLIVLAILFRTIWHLGPNIEFVTAASMLAAHYLGFWCGISVPLAVMFVSDILIRNTNIFIFTWSAFVLIGGLNGLFSTIVGKRRDAKIILAQTGYGVLASLFFYLYTNFGVWLLDSWGMYPRTLGGLIECYLMAVPFLRFQLIGNLIFVPVSFTLVELSLAFRKRKWPKLKLLARVSFFVLGLMLSGCNCRRQEVVTSTQPPAEIATPTPQAQAVLIIDFNREELATYSATLTNGITVYELLVEAAKSLGYRLETERFDFGVLIKAIGEVENTDERGWLYSINGQVGKVAADDAQVNPGDQVEWKYTNF